LKRSVSVMSFRFYFLEILRWVSPRISIKKMGRHILLRARHCMIQEILGGRGFSIGLNVEAASSREARTAGGDAHTTCGDGDE